MPTPYPRNRTLIKNLAQMWKQIVSPSRRNQSARVVPFNKNNTRTKKNGGGLFGRSRKVAPESYVSRIAAEYNSNNTMNNATRRALARRDGCLGRCQIAYKKRSLSRGGRIDWSGYLECCKMCRKETPYTKWELKKQKNQNMLNKTRRNNRNNNINRNNGNNNRNNRNGNNSSVSTATTYII
jgi:hypothetical protein